MFRSKRPRFILNEIKWRYDLGRCKVYYIHRGAPGDTRIIDGNAIIRMDRSFFILDEDVHIPYHRIFRIDYEGEPVYEKRQAQR